MPVVSITAVKTPAEYCSYHKVSLLSVLMLLFTFFGNKNHIHFKMKTKLTLYSMIKKISVVTVGGICKKCCNSRWHEEDKLNNETNLLHNETTCTILEMKLITYN